MTDETVAAAGLADRVVSIRDIGLSGTELTADQSRAVAKAIELANAAVHEDKADVIVLGAGSMEGMAARIQPDIPVPVTSPLGAAASMAEMIHLLQLPKPGAGRCANL